MKTQPRPASPGTHPPPPRTPVTGHRSHAGCVRALPRAHTRTEDGIFQPGVEGGGGGGGGCWAPLPPPVLPASRRCRREKPLPVSAVNIKGQPPENPPNKAAEIPHSEPVCHATSIRLGCVLCCLIDLSERVFKFSRAFILTAQSVYVRCRGRLDAAPLVRGD